MKKWALFSDSKNVILSFLSAILLMSGMAYFANQGHIRLVSFFESTEEKDRLLVEIRSLKRILSELQASELLILYTTEGVSLQSHKDTIQILNTSVSNLENYFTSNPEQIKRVKNLKTALENVTSASQESLVFFQNGDIEKAREKSIIKTQKEQLIVIRNLIFDIEKIEINARNARMSLMDRSSESQKTLVNIGFSVGILILITSGCFVIYSIRLREKAEKELNQFFSNSGDLFCIMNFAGQFKKINPGFMTTLGYSEEKLLKSSILDFVHPEDKAIVSLDLDNLRNKSEPLSIECRYAKSNGEYIWLSWKAQGSSESSALFAVARDVTQRRILEQQNIEARKAALAASEAKSQFLANMSHEIRTPMNGVIGMAKLMLDTSLNSEQKEQADNILSSAQNLLSIINDILDFSKIEAGKMSIEKIPFNINKIFNDVEKTLGFTAANKGLALKVDKTHFPFQVIGDTTRIRQVILNLTGNAIKFTQHGSVSIHVETKMEDSKNIKLRISVVDTGIGISKSAQERMFKAFSQADDSTSRKFGGTGLGLSISKQLVELMGGVIGLDSVEGQGSTFWFELPFEKGEAIKSEGENQIGFFNGAQFIGRVLVADDNHINQKVIGRTLNKMGVQNKVVSNGQEAVDALAQDQYDLVLMDCHMPVLDGYEATKAIRRQSHQSYSQIPIVALTANAMVGEREKCLSLGMNDFLTKPIEDDKMLEVLSRYLKVNKENKVSQASVVSIVKSEPTPSAVAKVEKVTANQASPTSATTGVVVENWFEDGQSIQVFQYDSAQDQNASLDKVIRDHLSEEDSEKIIHEIKNVILNSLNNKKHNTSDSVSASVSETHKYLENPNHVQDHLLDALSLVQMDKPIPKAHQDHNLVSQTSEKATLDMKAIQKLEMIQDDSEPDIVIDLIETFENVTPEKVKSLRAFLEEKNIEALSDEAHAIKSSARTLGATAFAEACQTVESIKDQPDDPDCEVKVVNLEKQFEVARHLLQELKLSRAQKNQKKSA